MSHRIRPSVVALVLALASSSILAKPVKPAAKPAPTPAATAEVELAHNLGSMGEERLQAIVDRFNKESGATLKLVRLEKGDKPAAIDQSNL